MPGPLIPYIVVPELPLGFLQHIPLLGGYIDPASPPTLKPFGLLVAIAMASGWQVSMKRARDRGLDTEKLGDFVYWSVGLGFVISHLLDAVAYHPDLVLADPLYLLRIWEGLSSYGGLIGGVIGAWAWGRYHKHDFLEYLDLCVSAFPFAWIFGRAGCALVHDHPGALSNAWLAVRYPAQTLQAGFAGRFDLGLLEMLMTIPLAVACHWLWRRNPRRPIGFYLGFTIATYAPVRFVLDFFRVTPDDPIYGADADPRYLSLTPAQWACFLGVALGAYWLLRTRGATYTRKAPLAPKPASGSASA